MNCTKIEWCERTWNPVTGCCHNCPYCYARRIAERFGGYTDCDTLALVKPDFVAGKIVELEEPEKIFDVENWRERVAPYPFVFRPTFHRYRLDEPSKTKKPQNIFVCSMADLFGEWVPDEWITAVFEACKAAPQHRYLFLTKNPKRYGDLYKNGNLPKLENFWYGTTVTKQSDKRFQGPLGMNTFLSIEPLMEYLDVGIGSFGSDNWLIIGAETGKRKGKIIPERTWVENIEEAAALTHIPIFYKDSLRKLFPDLPPSKLSRPLRGGWVEIISGIREPTEAGRSRPSRGGWVEIRIIVFHDGSRVFYDKFNPRTEITIRFLDKETEDVTES